MGQYTRLGGGQTSASRTSHPGFPSLFLASFLYFSMISPTCYPFRSSTSRPFISRPPYSWIPLFSLFTPLRLTSVGPFWTRWLDKVDSKHFSSFQLRKSKIYLLFNLIIMITSVNMRLLCIILAKVRQEIFLLMF